MKDYIGTKQIKAMLTCTAKEAAEILGREIETKNADAEGNGYLVKYKDGYTSWSPAKAFEEAYREDVSMSFGQAIEALKAGKKVCRSGWNGKGMYLQAQYPDEHSKMSLPYIYMKTACDNLVPWLASQTDILSEDWMVID